MSADLLAADLRRVTWRPLARGLGLVAVIAVAASGVIAAVRSGQHPFNLRTGLPSAYEHAAGPLALAAFVLGASLFGADYASRTFTTTLTWEPRRHRLLASRAAASATTAGCAALATLALLTAALMPAALIHHVGAFGGLPSLALLAARCAALAAAAAVLGVACAALTLSTVGALVSLAGYWLLAQLSLAGLWPASGHWLLLANAQSWIQAGHHAAAAGHSALVAGPVLLTTVLLLHATATWRLTHHDIN